MPDQEDFDDTEPQAKRTGRDSNNPRAQPGEFADDLRTNRFEPPPEPREREEEGE